MQRLAALVLCSLFAQEGEERGQFVLYSGGKKVGTEDWRVEKFPEGTTAVFAKTKMTFEAQGRTYESTNDTVLSLDKEGRPATYAGVAKVAGQDLETRLEIKAGKASCEITAAGKETKKESKFGAGSFLLDNDAFIQLGLMARAYDPKKGRFYAIRIFAVRTLTELDGSLDDRGRARITSGEKSVDVRHIIVNVGRLGISVYLREDGRVAAIHNPMQGFTAYLSDYAGWTLTHARIEIKRPDGVIESDVTFKSGPLTLAGSFTRPREGGRVPAVVLVSGSGPQDRDENVPATRREELYQWSVFKSIAYALSAAGFGVLRYDDRGVAASQGDFATAKLSDFVADAVAAVAHLRTRDDVDAERLGIVGHSEGGIIAPIVANQDGRVRALFLLAATALPLDAVLLQQTEAALREQGVADDAITRQLEKLRERHGEIRRAEGDWLTIDEQRTFIGWLREHFNHDPSAEIARVKAAVVVLQGMKDQQVYPSHAEMLEKAMKKAGKEDFEVRTFPDLDHLFMKFRAGLADYADPARRVDEGFLKSLVEAAGARLK